MANQDLGIRLLGDLEVIRDGLRLNLPPSRKTRALLAYLAMQERPLRREHLCELLWEVPDDPRGSLRWSLSKIRGLVDSADCQRIQADRNHVRLDTGDIDVDVQRMHALATSDLAGLDTAALRGALEQWQGNFLDGLELTNFYGFYAWCVAERERVTRSRAVLLGELVDRLADDPTQALGAARQLVLNSPYDQAARARLIRLLRQTGNGGEAEQQHQLGLRLLREVGGQLSDDLRLALRGHGPTAATAIPAEPATPARSAVPTPPRLAGRDEEFGLIAATLDQCLTQQSAQSLLVTGPPGIGKSQLLGCAGTLARDAGVTVLASSAYEPETLRPFALWLDLLRRYAPGESATLFATAASDNRDLLLERLANWVGEALEQNPVALLLDDFQWADDSSSQALAWLMSACRQQPLLLVVAAREGELNDNTAAHRVLRGIRVGGRLRDLRLGPLPAEALMQIIGDSVDTEDRERLSRECHGNPLLAKELAGAIAAGGRHDSLDAMIAERLAAAGTARAEVLQWASLFGQRIDIDTLARVTGLSSEAVGQALETGVQQDLLTYPDHGFRFTHDLLAKGVYHSISPTRQAIMHRRIAELLEQDTALDLERAADLAHHALHSGDPALAARSLVLAGRLCLRFFANHDAISLARKGLQLVRHLGEADQVCLSLDFHHILLTAAPLDDWQAAARNYHELAERALDHGATRHARMGYYMASYLSWYHGHWRGAREESLQAERITRGGNEEEHIIGMAETAKCLAMLEQDLPRADAMLREAMALAGRRRLSTCALSLARGMLFFYEGDLDAAEEQCLNARTLAKPAGDRVNEFLANECLVLVAFQRGDYAQARSRCRDLQQLAERFREGSEAPFANACAALCEYAIGEDDQPLGVAIAALREVDAKHRLACVLTRAAPLDIERGRPESARERATEALGCAMLLERATETLLARLALATACAQLHREDEFWQHRDAVSALLDAPVARWARKRAEEALRDWPAGQGSPATSPADSHPEAPHV